MAEQVFQSIAVKQASITELDIIGATKTGTGDVAVDGYVIIKINGVNVKFATVA